MKPKIFAIIAGVVVFALGVLAIPRPPSLSDETSGDAALVKEVRDLLAETPGVRDHVSVAVIDGSDVRVAHFGATGDTEYEIGSVTKTVTASLLVDAIERGEVDASTTLEDLLDVEGSAAASITLEELATQSSGLPRLATSPGMIINALIANYRASDPYGSTVDELVDSARTIPVGEKKFEYSNLGFALLGQSLAAATDTDYSSLAAERVFEPLGMDDTFAPTSTDDLADDAPTGYTASGRSSDPWTLGADAPAGSVRSTLADMTTYVRAQLDETAPGVAATEPREKVEGAGEIGYAWFTTDGVTWHNGGTGGFTSWVGFDRETGRGVVVLNNSTTSVDDVGFGLMEGN